MLVRLLGLDSFSTGSRGGALLFKAAVRGQSAGGRKGKLGVEGRREGGAETCNERGEAAELER